MKIEDLKYKFDCVMGMPVGPFTRIEGQNLSLEMATIDQLQDRLGMLESLTNDIILYIEEKERAAADQATKVIEVEEAAEQLQESGFCDPKRLAHLELLVSRIAFLLAVDPTQTAIEAEITHLKGIRYDQKEARRDDGSL